MLTALDALPEKRLIAEELEHKGEVCALGSVGKMRGMDMSNIDPEDYSGVANAFGIAEAMAREIEYINDESWGWHKTPEERFNSVRKWVVENLRAEEG